MFKVLPNWTPRTWVLLSFASLLIFVPGFSTSPGHAVQAQAQPQRMPADLSGGVAWLNHDKELTLEDLRGRVVLLDFWTLC